MRALLLGLALVLLAGCGLMHPRAQLPAPINAGCDSACYAPCNTADISWTADPDQPAAWDAVGDQVVQPLAQRVAECSRINRHACHVCLLRLQAAGVIIGVPPDPNP